MSVEYSYVALGVNHDVIYVVSVRTARPGDSHSPGWRDHKPKRLKYFKAEHLPRNEIRRLRRFDATDAGGNLSDWATLGQDGATTMPAAAPSQSPRRHAATKGSWMAPHGFLAANLPGVTGQRYLIWLLASGMAADRA
ncbi:hypothetical protein Purlil1_840 [Purpureocillium lilacinum]|uniref:Uncharacterized protein n=1 Tax=Purpureocillium lilacinum TaxID=33203 RepID=A0ABR0CFF2_PURLI|nr:hypothetical protein Purlil1_840 [Purpureocillium lilacinum]